VKFSGKVLLSLLLLLGTVASATAQSPRQVLVVYNAANSESTALAKYYQSRRGVPSTNMFSVSWSADDNADTCTLAQYQNQIATPIFNKIRQLTGIDYIVLCRNLPLKIRETTGSVDSALAGNSTVMRNNPYFAQRVPFSAAATGMYLVTRLDGWSWQDARALVDRAVAARMAGPILLDQDPSKNGEYSYYLFNYYMDRAFSALSANYLITLDKSAAFVKSSQPLKAYVSWGSNDAAYAWTTYNQLRFTPGAIAETAVSTSASNLRFPGGGQSQIAELIRNGVSGVKGYVSEPQIAATAQAHILLINYTSGRNLAESFYSASKFLGWKDVIVGDPLCRFALLQLSREKSSQE